MSDFTLQNKKLVEKLHALENDLQDPNIINNQEKYKKVALAYDETKKNLDIFDKFEETKKALKTASTALKQEKDEEYIKLAEEEIARLESEYQALEKKIKILLIPKDPLDQRDIIIEIRAGAGGDEAALFAAELYRMYTRFAEENKWQHQLISQNQIGIGGFKEVIFEIIGNNVYSALKYESGVHRVQRVPETEKSGRVHTSTVTVAVLPEAEDVDINLKDSDLRIDVYRSGGHGGQSVNTTDSAVRITHLPTGLIVTCQDEKSQHKNKAKAFKVLRSRLLAQKQEEEMKKRINERRAQIGTGDRSEKIRTYNFPQDRITDHRIKQSWHEINKIIDGKLDIIINDLKEAEYQKIIQNS